MEKIGRVTNAEEARHLLEVALRHEWAVSFEYMDPCLLHAEDEVLLRGPGHEIPDRRPGPDDPDRHRRDVPRLPAGHHHHPARRPAVLQNGRGRPLPPDYPVAYAGEDRLSALRTLVPDEKKIIAAYEELIARLPASGIRDRLELQLAVKREHLYTQESLLANAGRVPGLR